MQEEQAPPLAALQAWQVASQLHSIPFQIYPSVQLVQDVVELQSTQFRGQAMHSRLFADTEKPGLHREQVVVRAFMQVAQLAITKLQAKHPSPAAFK